MSYPIVDPVCILLTTPFHLWEKDLGQQVLSAEARPRPYVRAKNLSKTERQLKKHVQSIWYNKNSWLCGSHYLKRFYCWPCLLFGSIQTVWNSSGFNEFQNADAAFEEHAQTMDHIKSEAYYKTVVRPDNSDEVLNGVHISDYNDLVRLNRQIIILGIDAFLYLNKLKVVDFKDDLVNNFEQLFALLISKSPLELQMQYSKIKDIFTLKRMQSFQEELHDCLAEHLHHYIHGELVSAVCFGIQIDDITDIQQKSHCCLSVRYLNESGHLVEWFYGIYNTSVHQTAEDIIAILDEAFEGTDYEQKLVSVAHDSRVLSQDQLELLEMHVKSKAPEAVVANNHSLSTHVLQRCYTNIKVCRFFFSTIQMIIAFFKRFPDRKQIKNLPVVKILSTELNSTSEWWYYSRLFLGLTKDWHQLKTVFIDISKDNELNEECYHASKCFLNDMNDIEFAFLCELFKHLFFITDSLYYQIRSLSLDIESCIKEIESNVTEIREMKVPENFENILRPACNKLELHITDEYRHHLKTLSDVIVETIVTEFENRFRSIQALGFFSLIDPCKFESHSKHFPENEFLKLIEQHPKYFERYNHLRVELQDFYNDESFWGQYVYNIPKLIYQNNQYMQCYVETYKLFSLIITIHFSVAFGSSMARLQELKKFKGSQFSLDTFWSFANLTMNKDLINHMLMSIPFHEEIVDKFYYYTKNDKGFFLLYRA